MINAFSDGAQLSNAIPFRADANPAIGFGHLMRCLSIADAVASFNREAPFILVDNTMQAIVTDRGYPLIVLGTAYNELEGETEKICSILAENKLGALVVDSYFVTEQYLNV